MGIVDWFLRKDQDNKANLLEERNLNSNFAITSFFGSDGRVSEKEALKIPAVATSVELICSSISQLPIFLYQENEKGEHVRVQDNRVFLLNNEPNELVNGHNFKKNLVKDYLFHGASYTKIERYRNDVLALYLIPIEEVSVTKYRINSYRYSAKVNVLGESNKTIDSFDPEELVVVLRDSEDGITGEGVLTQNADTLSLAIDEQDYTTGVLKNGALPIGILKSTSRLTESAISRLRSSWENLYSGAKKAGKTLILEEGLDYKPISMKPNELDLTNIRKHTVSEIARIFNIPESMLNASANKYASNEQNNIHFLQYCIAPIVTAIESSLNKSLLLEEEKRNGYYFRFDVSELLRTTEKEKIETVVRAMKDGLISFNEARSRIQLPSIDVDYFTWGLGSVFYNPETGKMTIPNMGVTIDPDNISEEDAEKISQAGSQVQESDEEKPEEDNKDEEQENKKDDEEV